ncbi:Gfo/Idh/MocA family oxidoreductase [Raineyella sp. LH-20]|uniref:Gfo/Idh/MocA family protein n=1 Tax=Raineyella sp. LH-20 TaxID=3081204 RepID=UPI002955CDCD|nr:Gfo/Idh/MocA family oxidoreductase [Raineyella sp. LH-20]WOP19319.1 Gfo/Idh/MocA family oxidoreductase [Raineyella sp. LH-20]
MSRPLRAALLGAGDVARLHADALAAMDGVALVSAADTADPSAFCDRHGIPGRYTSLEEMLRVERPDVVHLCTPPGGHAGQAISCFAAGAHVIAEKPAALSLVEVDAMIDAGRRADRKLAIVFQQRTGTAAAHVRELLRSGRLGRPMVANCQTLWYRDQAYFDVPWRGTFATEGGGTTLGHSIHQIDLLGYLLGDWRSASARMWRRGRETETEDTVTGTLLFDDGVVASVLGTVLAPRQVSAIRIDTDVATVELEHLYGHGHANWRITPLPGHAPDPAWAWPRDEVPSGHDDYLRQIYASLLSGSDLPDIASGPRRSMEIVSAMYASARRNGAEVTAAELAAEPELRGPLFVVPRELRDMAR